MNKYLSVGLLMIIPLYGISKATEELVQSMVPRGEVSQKSGSNYTVKTPYGTKVIVEFDHTGELDEASGLSLNKGDIFEPGNGLITLGTVAQKLKKNGHILSSEWSLEKDSHLGWIYELSETKQDEKVSLVVSAKNAKLIIADK